MNPRSKLSDCFSREEIQRLSQRSDAAGWWAIGSTWAIIAAAFAMLAIWPNPVTFLLALVILGGRQLALAILMHEAAHGTLFRTRWLNDRLTDWLCARIIWVDVARYRKHHIRHHAHTGTDQDPDWSLSRPFPTHRASLLRKFARDLSGLSGLRRLFGQLLMDLGVLEYTVAADVKRRPRDGRTWRDYAREGLRNMTPMLLANALLASMLLRRILAVRRLVAGQPHHLQPVHAHPLAGRTRLHRAWPRHAAQHPNHRAGWLARSTVAPLR